MPEHVMNYIETEAPVGLTLVDWHRVRLAAKPRRRRRRLLPPMGRGPAFA
jgi:hypothetical protein